MKERKKHLRYLLLLVVLFLFCAFKAQAQPQCFSNFDLHQTCNSEYQLKEFVFFGRVVSVASESVADENYNGFLKVIVEIEESFKGNLAGKTEVFLAQRCFGRIVKDERYIFTAERFAGGNLSGIFSDKWSEPFANEYSKSDFEEVFAKIRSVVKKVKQPRLTGSIIQYDWTPFFRNLTFGGKTIFAYDPRKARPVANIVVVAKRKDNKEFKTKTDASGYFEFKNLPSGEYETYPNLPKDFNVIAFGEGAPNKEANGMLVQIDDSICGKSVIFNTQLQGKIIVRGNNALNSWAQVGLHLLRVENRSENRELYNLSDGVLQKTSLTDDKSKFNFYSSFEEIPVGPYILAVSIHTDLIKPEIAVYYPGTFEREKAEIINVEAGKTKIIELSLPDLPAK